jgi:hypothetical protein
MACPRPRPIPLLCKKARSKEGDASKRRDGTWSANCRPNASVTHKQSNAACEREKKKKALPLLDFDSNPQSQGTRQKPSEKKKGTLLRSKAQGCRVLFHPCKQATKPQCLCLTRRRRSS